MVKSVFQSLGRSAFLLILTSGCVTGWRPPMETVESEPAEAGFDLAPYLRANRIGRWVYERREIGAADDQQPVTYIRRIEATGEAEGGLEHREFLPIPSYLLTDADTATQPTEQRDRPVPPLKERWAFFFEVTNPMPSIPADLDLSGPIETATRLRYYWHNGQRLSEGQLTRIVQIEGFEDVECPAGRFEQCLRIRLDLRIRFLWGLAVDWTSYFWLSPEAGEVRRVQRFSGWLWFFPFASAHECSLVSHTPAAGPNTLPVGPKWQYGAIVFDRGLPRPQIAGLAVDYAHDQ
jgi:hypothetical protein